MSLVAEFLISTRALPFGDVLASNLDIRIEVERIFPTSERALPYFWAWGCPPDTFLVAFEQESGIRETRLLERHDAGGLYRAEWGPPIEIIDYLERHDGTILELAGSAEWSRLTLRAQQLETLATFQRTFTD